MVIRRRRFGSMRRFWAGRSTAGTRCFCVFSARLHDGFQTLEVIAVLLLEGWTRPSALGLLQAAGAHDGRQGAAAGSLAIRSAPRGRDDKDDGGGGGDEAGRLEARFVRGERWRPAPP